MCVCVCVYACVYVGKHVFVKFCVVAVVLEQIWLLLVRLVASVCFEWPIDDSQGMRQEAGAVTRGKGRQGRRGCC